jgi:hypothetical protein
MYDLSIPNDRPGQCAKCGGSGMYRWGATVNGKSQHSGPCFSCQGTGQQSARQIRRNQSYNRHKLASMGAADRDFDPGELAADQWAMEHCPSDNT